MPTDIHEINRKMRQIIDEWDAFYHEQFMRFVDGTQEFKPWPWSEVLQPTTSTGRGGTMPRDTQYVPPQPRGTEYPAPQRDQNIPTAQEPTLRPAEISVWIGDIQEHLQLLEGAVNGLYQGLLPVLGPDAQSGPASPPQVVAASTSLGTTLQAISERVRQITSLVLNMVERLEL